MCELPVKAGETEEKELQQAGRNRRANVLGTGVSPSAATGFRRESTAEARP